MNPKRILSTVARWLLTGVFHAMNLLAAGCLWVGRQATAGIVWLDAGATK